jgi:glucose-6-phosphate isomerase
MIHNSIFEPSQYFKPESWFLQGKSITSSEKRIRDLKGVFGDETAFNKSDPEMLVYKVQAHLPVKEGTPGGLFFGTTTIQPGKIGDEYFMTRGHFHAKADRGEYYWGVQGEGMLILMDTERETWAEKMFPGSLHYIGSYIAHRVANTGNTSLIFGACWISDAGHNYEEIEQNGFSSRLLEIKKVPLLIDAISKYEGRP